MVDTHEINGRVALLVEDGVADVRFVRSEKLNVLDYPAFQAIVAAADWIAQHREVRAVVLRGEGPAFCAGLDLAFAQDVFSEGSPVSLLERSRDGANLFQLATMAWHDLPVPVIAALHGATFGGGLQIALGADLRFCAPDTRLSIMEMRWGLIPDMAGTLLLRNLVRGDVLRDLVYTGRVVDAIEASELGLVTRLCQDPVAEALTAARSIAEGKPAAMRAAKRLLNRASDLVRDDTLMAESDEQAAIITGGDPLRAIQAYLSATAVPRDR